jgi:hypothetical protein
MIPFNMQVIPKNEPYPSMNPEKRRALLPEHCVSSSIPAVNFDDAFITGNGSHRVDILGDPFAERIAFTHELNYEPVWNKTPEPPDLTGILPDMRRLMLKGKYEEAINIVHNEQYRQGFAALIKETDNNVFLPPRSLERHHAFFLNINQQFSDRPEDYLRYLDMENGEVTVRWNTQAGVYRRRTFASFASKAVYQLFEAPEPFSLSFTILPPDLAMPELCSIAIQSSEKAAVVSCAYCPEYGRKGYIAAMRIIRCSGTAQAVRESVTVEGASSLLLITRIMKYESNFSHDLAVEIMADLEKLDDNYNNVLAANRSYLGGRMGLSSINLSGGTGRAMTAEELIREQHTCGEFSAALLEKLYDMGRFFQIIDTGKIPPMWGQHNINTNLQVCAGNITGLDREMDVYFRYYESKFDDFRINAKRLFGARGLLCSVHCDYNSGLYYHFSRTFPHYCWTGCLGWIYNEFWGHYLVSGDREFLKNRIIPVLKEIALFFEDYAKDTDSEGQSIFYPSFSPENPTPELRGVYATSINSVMDIMICREVLDNLIGGCRELGIEDENIPHWEEQQARLPKYLLDDEGGIKEWAWASINENYNHRHVSHHYDVWPGHAITWEDTPELARAVLISNRKRGQQNDSAHGIIHRLFTAIRLKDLGDTVHNLKQLMEHGFITRTLNCYHNPYAVHCPDLTGAMPAVLAEMIVYSAPGVVEFLPALPASLKKGNIRGIWLYTFAKLEHLEWDLESGSLNAELISIRDQKIKLRLRRKFSEVVVNKQILSPAGDHVLVDIKAGVPYCIKIKYGQNPASQTIRI